MDAFFPNISTVSIRRKEFKQNLFVQTKERFIIYRIERQMHTYNIIYNNSGILEFYCHSRPSKSNLQRRRRVSIVLLHRVLHQPSTYEHACQLRILHFRWIVARRQYRFQSHAYVLVQGRNHPLGHLAGSYHVRGPGYKLGRGDRYVTFRRALRITVLKKKRKKIDRRIRRIIRRATKNILTTVDTTSLICFIPSALPKK